MERPTPPHVGQRSRPFVQHRRAPGSTFEEPIPVKLVTFSVDGEFCLNVLEGAVRSRGNDIIKRPESVIIGFEHHPREQLWITIESDQSLDTHQVLVFKPGTNCSGRFVRGICQEDLIDNAATLTLADSR